MVIFYLGHDQSYVDTSGKKNGFALKSDVMVPYVMVPRESVLPGRLVQDLFETSNTPFHLTLTHTVHVCRVSLVDPVHGSLYKSQMFPIEILLP